MTFKKLKIKKFLTAFLGIVFFVSGVWIIQTPTTEAATISKEFIRVKLDSSDTTQLWNFFATDNGYFDDFSATGTFYTDPSTGTEYPDYTCGLLLTEEFGGGVNDDDYILWARKGTILGEGNSLSADVTDYKACCDESNFVSDSCTINTTGHCSTYVYTASDYVFKKTYGTLNENECNDDVNQAPCDATPADCCALSTNYSGAEYKFHYQPLCDEDGKWLQSDQPGVCSSDGTNDYFATATDDGRLIWIRCATGGCNEGTGCVGGSVPPPVPGPGPSGGIVFQSPSKFTDLMELVGSIVNFLSYLAIALAVLMLVIAAFLFMTAGGEAQKVNTARTLVFYTLLGLLIIVLAKAISAAVKYAVS